VQFNSSSFRDTTLRRLAIGARRFGGSVVISSSGVECPVKKYLTLPSNAASNAGRSKTLEKSSGQEISTGKERQSQGT
jgi:hypothetical protein